LSNQTGRTKSKNQTVLQQTGIFRQDRNNQELLLPHSSSLTQQSI